MLTIAVDTALPVPPYEQVRTQIAQQVATGALPAGTRLATVRQMAADLGLAANTVARAYRELEADGVIATHGRRGTFVRSENVAAPPDSLRAIAETYTNTARRLGLTRAEATRILEQVWST